MDSIRENIEKTLKELSISSIVNKICQSNDPEKKIDRLILRIYLNLTIYLAILILSIKLINYLILPRSHNKKDDRFDGNDSGKNPRIYQWLQNSNGGIDSGEFGSEVEDGEERLGTIEEEEEEEEEDEEEGEEEEEEEEEGAMDLIVNVYLDLDPFLSSERRVSLDSLFSCHLKDALEICLRNLNNSSYDDNNNNDGDQKRKRRRRGLNRRIDYWLYVDLGEESKDDQERLEKLDLIERVLIGLKSKNSNMINLIDSSARSKKQLLTDLLTSSSSSGKESLKVEDSKKISLYIISTNDSGIVRYGLKVLKDHKNIPDRTVSLCFLNPPSSSLKCLGEISSIDTLLGWDEECLNLVDQTSKDQSKEEEFQKGSSDDDAYDKFEKVLILIFRAFHNNHDYQEGISEESSFRTPSLRLKESIKILKRLSIFSDDSEGGREREEEEEILKFLDRAMSNGILDVLENSKKTGRSSRPFKGLSFGSDLGLILTLRDDEDEGLRSKKNEEKVLLRDETVGGDDDEEEHDQVLLKGLNNNEDDGLTTTTGSESDNFMNEIDHLGEPEGGFESVRGIGDLIDQPFRPSYSSTNKLQTDNLKGSSQKPSSSSSEKKNFREKCWEELSDGEKLLKNRKKKLNLIESDLAIDQKRPSKKSKNILQEEEEGAPSLEEGPSRRFNNKYHDRNDERSFNSNDESPSKFKDRKTLMKQKKNKEKGSRRKSLRDRVDINKDEEGRGGECFKSLEVDDDRGKFLKEKTSQRDKVMIEGGSEGRSLNLSSSSPFKEPSRLVLPGEEALTEENLKEENSNSIEKDETLSTERKPIRVEEDLRYFIRKDEKPLNLRKNLLTNVLIPMRSLTIPLVLMRMITTGIDNKKFLSPIKICSKDFGIFGELSFREMIIPKISNFIKSNRYNHNSNSNTFNSNSNSFNSKVKNSSSFVSIGEKFKSFKEKKEVEMEKEGFIGDFKFDGSYGDEID